MNRIKIHSVHERNSQRINKKSIWKNGNLNKPMRIQHDVKNMLCSFTACLRCGSFSVSHGADYSSQASIGYPELYTLHEHSRKKLQRMLLQ